ncbi:MAG: transglycosylase SLT domain-containing protein [Gemmatimonadaceae bacterium]
MPIRLRDLLGLTIVTATVAACSHARPASPSAPTPVGAAATPSTSPKGGERGASAPRETPIPTPPPVPDSVQESLRLAMRAIELFGDSIGTPPANAAPAGPTGSSGGPASEEASWDIEVRSFVTHDRVDRYVKLFSGPARERFVSWLQRGRRYEPMIRSTFRARGVPEDMYYLGAVESGYDPHAVSRAYAVGIWQFMTTTAKGFGLRVDWWVDERRDPMKSTDAAARFLSALKDQFGSYYLAAAAYNGGPGRVKRGLTRYANDLDDTYGDDCFFALVDVGALRSETVNYVPQLIAAAYIAKDATQFGVVLDTLAPRYAYDSVQVGPNVPLSAVARAAGASIAEVRDLNPYVLRGVTPPEGTLYVRVPSGRAGTADSALRELSPDSSLAYRVHVTRKGETLGSVANKYGISSRQLAWYNRKVSTGRKGVLTAGQRLSVPTLDVLAAAFDVPDPAIEKYGRSSGSRAHVVKRGESLGSIARRYHTSVATLVRLNRLKKPVIYPGQTIIVAGGSSGARRGASASKRTSSSSSKSPTTSKKKKAASSPKAASKKR